LEVWLIEDCLFGAKLVTQEITNIVADVSSYYG